MHTNNIGIIYVIYTVSYVNTLMTRSLASLIVAIAPNQSGVIFLNVKHQFNIRSILLNHNCLLLLDSVQVLNLHNNAL